MPQKDGAARFRREHRRGGNVSAGAETFVRDSGRARPHLTAIQDDTSFSRHGTRNGASGLPQDSRQSQRQATYLQRLRLTFQDVANRLAGAAASHSYLPRLHRSRDTKGRVHENPDGSHLSR